MSEVTPPYLDSHSVSEFSLRNDSLNGDCTTAAVARPLTVVGGNEERLQKGLMRGKEPIHKYI